MHKHVAYVLTFAVIMFAASVNGDPASAQSSIDWLTLAEAQERAAAEGMTVLVFVEAEWCGVCKRVKREVLPEEGVRQLMDERYLPVSIDLDSREEVVFNGQRLTEREFARAMDVTATPTMIFISPVGEVMGSHAGFVPAVRFHALLRYVTSEAFGDVTFETFLDGKMD